MTGKRIIVVGAGIIGASIAWHLAKAGAEVTVIEAGEPGGVATRNSWAWINASWGNPETYFRLLNAPVEEWRRIDREVPGWKSIGAADCSGTCRQINWKPLPLSIAHGVMAFAG